MGRFPYLHIQRDVTETYYGKFNVETMEDYFDFLFPLQIPDIMGGLIILVSTFHLLYYVSYRQRLSWALAYYFLFIPDAKAREALIATGSPK